MAISQARPRRRSTGSRYKWRGKKKIIELGREPSLTAIGEKKLLKIRARGNNRKYRLLSSDIANVFDKKSKKFFKVKIKSVAENPANRNYVRRNIMTMGAIIDTEKGKARVTSRPGQDGTINAVLLD